MGLPGLDVSAPHQLELKFAGEYPLPFGLQVAGSYQSYPPDIIIWNWSVPRSVFAAAGQVRTQPTTVRLNPSGTIFAERMHQIDLSLSKWFNLSHGMRWKLGVDVYNLTNSDFVEDFNMTTFDSPNADRFDPNGGLGYPVETLVGRFWKITTRFQF